MTTFNSRATPYIPHSRQSLPINEQTGFSDDNYTTTDCSPSKKRVFRSDLLPGRHIERVYQVDQSREIMPTQKWTLDRFSQLPNTQNIVPMSEEEGKHFSSSLNLLLNQDFCITYNNNEKLENMPDLGNISLNTFLEKFQNKLSQTNPDFGHLIKDTRIYGSGANFTLFGQPGEEKSLRDIDVAQYLERYPISCSETMKLLREFKRIFIAILVDIGGGAFDRLPRSVYEACKGDMNECIKKYYLNNALISSGGDNCWLLIGFGRLELRITLTAIREYTSSSHSFQVSIRDRKAYCHFNDVMAAKQHVHENFFFMPDPIQVQNCFIKSLKELLRHEKYSMKNLSEICEAAYKQQQPFNASNAEIRTNMDYEFANVITAYLEKHILNNEGKKSLEHVFVFYAALQHSSLTDECKKMCAERILYMISLHHKNKEIKGLSLVDFDILLSKMQVSLIKEEKKFFFLQFIQSSLSHNNPDLCYLLAKKAIKCSVFEKEDTQLYQEVIRKLTETSNDKHFQQAYELFFFLAKHLFSNRDLDIVTALMVKSFLQKGSKKCFSLCFKVLGTCLPNWCVSEHKPLLYGFLHNCLESDDKEIINAALKLFYRILEKKAVSDEDREIMINIYLKKLASLNTVNEILSFLEETEKNSFSQEYIELKKMAFKRICQISATIDVSQAQKVFMIVTKDSFFDSDIEKEDIEELFHVLLSVFARAANRDGGKKYLSYVNTVISIIEERNIFSQEKLKNCILDIAILWSKSTFEQQKIRAFLLLLKHVDIYPENVFANHVVTLFLQCGDNVFQPKIFDVIHSKLDSFIDFIPGSIKAEFLLKLLKFDERQRKNSINTNFYEKRIFLLMQKYHTILGDNLLYKEFLASHISSFMPLFSNEEFCAQYSFLQTFVEENIEHFSEKKIQEFYNLSIKKYLRLYLDGDGIYYLEKALSIMPERAAACTQEIQTMLLEALEKEVMAPKSFDDVYSTFEKSMCVLKHIDPKLLNTKLSPAIDRVFTIYDEKNLENNLRLLDLFLDYSIEIDMHYYPFAFLEVFVREGSIREVYEKISLLQNTNVWYCHRFEGIKAEIFSRLINRASSDLAYIDPVVNILQREIVQLDEKYPDVQNHFFIQELSKPQYYNTFYEAILSWMEKRPLLEEEDEVANFYDLLLEHKIAENETVAQKQKIFEKFFKSAFEGHFKELYTLNRNKNNPVLERRKMEVFAKAFIAWVRLIIYSKKLSKEEYLHSAATLAKNFHMFFEHPDTPHLRLQEFHEYFKQSKLYSRLEEYLYNKFHIELSSIIYEMGRLNNPNMVIQAILKRRYKRIIEFKEKVDNDGNKQWVGTLKY